MHRCSLNILHFQAVLLTKAHQNIVVCLRQIVDNTVDIRLDIFRTLDIQVLVGTDMQGIGNTEMIPEKLMQGGILVNPDNFIDGDDGISINGGFNEKMLRDKHVLRGKLGQGRKLFLRLL